MCCWFYRSWCVFLPLYIIYQHFSSNAFFCFAGESLETNIKREIAEEVGLEVSNIEYCASQHWALPSSQLMLGCIATAATEDFDIDTDELEGAQWVTAQELKDAVDRVRTTKSLAEINENVNIIFYWFCFKFNNEIITNAVCFFFQVLWVPPQSAVAHGLMVAWLQKHHQYVPPVISRI